MWFEDLLLLALLGSGVFFIGIPLYKLVRVLHPSKRNPLADAKERHEQARLEVEAAKLDRESQKLYDQMYKEVLEDEEQEDQQEKHK